MKKTHQIKRDRHPTTKLMELKKPFGVCCDINHQDPNTQYNMRYPPYESTFEDTSFDNKRPEVKFRVQDTARVTTTTTTLRAVVFREDVEIKKAATYGKSKKGRGPLLWYIEEEIDAAREAVAQKKKAESKERLDKMQKAIALRRLRYKTDC